MVESSPDSAAARDVDEHLARIQKGMAKRADNKAKSKAKSKANGKAKGTAKGKAKGTAKGKTRGTAKGKAKGTVHERPPITYSTILYHGGKIYHREAKKAFRVLRRPALKRRQQSLRPRGG